MPFFSALSDLPSTIGSSFRSLSELSVNEGASVLTGIMDEKDGEVVSGQLQFTGLLAVADLVDGSVELDRSGGTTPFWWDADVIESALVVRNDGTWSLDVTALIGDTPMGEFTGLISFDILVSNGEQSLTETVTIAIDTDPENTAPRFGDNSFTLNENTTLTGSIAATDYDGDGLTFQLVQGEGTATAAGGLIVINEDGTFTYTPPEDFSGLDFAAVQVFDGNDSDQGPLIFNVEDVVTRVTEDVTHTIGFDNPVSYRFIGAEARPEETVFETSISINPETTEVVINFEGMITADEKVAYLVLEFEDDSAFVVDLADEVNLLPGGGFEALYVENGIRIDEDDAEWPIVRD